jgi:hypothetical protein
MFATAAAAVPEVYDRTADVLHGVERRGRLVKKKPLLEGFAARDPLPDRSASDDGWRTTLPHTPLT